MLKVVSIQTDIIWENVVNNKIHYDYLLKDIRQVDLIIFPENVYYWIFNESKKDC